MTDPNPTLPDGVLTSTITFGPYTDVLGQTTQAGMQGAICPVDPVTLQPVRLVHVSNGAVILPAPISFVLDADASGSVGPLPRQGTGQFSPDDFVYLVTWKGSNSPGSRPVALPADALDTVDYDQMAVAIHVAEPAFSDPIPAAVCPECGGEQLTPHPAGLVFRHRTLDGCSLQAKEDARLVADQGRGGERPTTPTERTLLAAAGITVPDDATCLVEWLSPGVRRRTWLVA